MFDIDSHRYTEYFFRVAKNLTKSFLKELLFILFWYNLQNILNLNE